MLMRPVNREKFPFGAWSNRASERKPERKRATALTRPLTQAYRWLTAGVQDGSRATCLKSEPALRFRFKAR